MVNDLQQIMCMQVYELLSFSSGKIGHMKFKPRRDVSQEGRNPFTILGIAARPLNRSEVELDLVIINNDNNSDLQV